MDFLQVRSGLITNASGHPVRLQGVNLGNWLLIEGYMLAGPNEPEHRIRGSLARHIGASRTRAFFERYQQRYIQLSDLKRIRSWGFNVARIPLNYHLFMTSSEKSLYHQNGLERLDWLVRASSKLGLYLILDLHAAPGAQNADWHSDSPGKAGLWSSRKYRDRVIQFWKDLAERYKEESAIAGYDLLNEPITDKPSLLANLYKDCISEIRSIGDRHIIFLEGTRWSDDFNGLEDIQDEQVAYSPHFYKPFQFTFNTELDLTYPGRVQGKLWNKQALRHELQRFARLGRSTQRPILIGEFGVNTRCPVCHAETQWVKECVDLFKEYGFHWTYWAYKVISSHMHPSGLLRFPQNPSWVHREGVSIGWETLSQIANKERSEFLQRMDSDHFVTDKPVLQALQS